MCESIYRETTNENNQFKKMEIYYSYLIRQNFKGTVVNFLMKDHLKLRAYF